MVNDQPLENHVEGSPQEVKEVRELEWMLATERLEPTRQWW